MNLFNSIFGKPAAVEPPPVAPARPGRPLRHLSQLAGGARALEIIRAAEAVLKGYTWANPHHQPLITAKYARAAWEVLQALANAEKPWTPPPLPAPSRRPDCPFVWDDETCMFPSWEITRTGGFGTHREWQRVDAKLPAEVEAPLREWLGQDYHAVHVQVRPGVVLAQRVRLWPDGTPAWKVQDPQLQPDFRQDLESKSFARKPVSGKLEPWRETA